MCKHEEKKYFIIIIIISITRCYVKANSFVQFLCPKFVYVEFALTSSRYSYGINPIVGIRLNVEDMLVIIIIIIIIIIIMIIYDSYIAHITSIYFSFICAVTYITLPKQT